MTDEKLYFEYENLIFSIAKDVAESFHCIKTDENGLTEYSRQLLEDLKSEGTVEFFRLLQSKEYDESKVGYVLPNRFFRATQGETGLVRFSHCSLFPSSI